MMPPPPVVADANRSGLHALVLAAGASRRYGSPKQLALIDGVPMLQRVIETAQAALPPDEHGSRITVVLGAHAPAIQAAIEFNDVQVIECPDWDSGMAHSLRFGLAALEALESGPDTPSAALVLLGDTPYITADDLRRLIDAWCASPETPAAAAYDGTIGAPCILPRAVWQEMMKLEGDRGAAAWLRGPRGRKYGLILAEMSTAAEDVDL